MNAKRVLIIVLIVSLLGVSTAQAYAFDIDDIDSPDVQSVQATTNAPTVSSTAVGIIMEKLRDISDED